MDPNTSAEIQVASVLVNRVSKKIILTLQDLSSGYQVRAFLR